MKYKTMETFSLSFIVTRCQKIPRNGYDHQKYGKGVAY